MCLGGENNVASAAHCATRLRLVLNDDKKANIKKIEKMEAVKGVFNSGLLMGILGKGITYTFIILNDSFLRL